MSCSVVLGEQYRSPMLQPIATEGSSGSGCQTAVHDCELSCSTVRGSESQLLRRAQRKVGQRLTCYYCFPI